MKVAALVLLGALIGAAGVYYLVPPKEVVKTKEVTVDRIVKDIVTVTKIVEKPGGIKETTTTTTDKSKESTKYIAIAEKVTLAPTWHVSGSVATDRQQMIYGLQVEKRIIGNLFLGVKAESNGSVGALIGLEF